MGTALLAPAVSARDDVPADVAARSNPVELDEQEVSYYQRQFKGNCARCHGLDGTGRGSDAGSQPVPPANFTDAKYMNGRSDGQLFYQILMGGGDRCAMPAFGPGSDHSWSEEKIWHMVAFVRRFAVHEGH
jgi:mono/diheme cytochrome c family protein